MDGVVSCPKCKSEAKAADYFCFNCGYKLRNKPLSTSLPTQLGLYIKTLLLPPLGIIWGMRYLRQSDSASKLIGIFVIVLTVAETIWLTQTTVTAIDSFNTQLNSQLRLYGL